MHELAEVPAADRRGRYVCVLALAVPERAAPGGLRIIERRGGQELRIEQLGKLDKLRKLGQFELGWPDSHSQAADVGLRRGSAVAAAGGNADFQAVFRGLELVPGVLRCLLVDDFER